MLAQAESWPVAEQPTDSSSIHAGSRTVVREVTRSNAGCTVLQGTRQETGATGTPRACRGSQVSGTTRGLVGGHSTPPVRLAIRETAQDGRRGAGGEGRVSVRYHRDGNHNDVSFTVESRQMRYARD